MSRPDLVIADSLLASDRPGPLVARGGSSAPNCPPTLAPGGAAGQRGATGSTEPAGPGGHDQHIGQLYRSHHPWLLTWLRRKLGNGCDAADLAHDTFVRLLRKGSQEPIREPRAYLTTIAGALVNSHWRRQALERAWLEALAARPPMLVPSPEERRIALDALEEAARLLAGLPPLVSEAFLLAQLDGLTYEQVADRLGISVHRVQRAMTRALTHCYRALYP